MFISTLQIKNYKAFHSDDAAIQFKVPDGHTPGSGLNIFVGENGTGKTSVLESINLLTQSKFSTLNKLSIFDFRDDTESIEISATTDRVFDYEMPETYRGCVFECNGIHFLAQPRKEKQRGKLLSEPLRVAIDVINTEPNYKTPTGKKDKEILAFHKIFEPSKLSEDLSIFFFDKYRTRHISKGTFRTTFDRIIDDLNWKFLKELREAGGTHRDELAKLSDQYFSEIVTIAQKGAGSKIAKATQKFFGNSEYEAIKIDFINLLWPFSDAFFSLRTPDDLAQIPVAKLGSGIEMIFTLLLLKSISEQSKGSIIYLIDEPEISLHPQAQKTLLNLLIEESKDKQIFISTHSPYFIEPTLITNVHKFERKDDHVKICAVPDTVDFGSKEKGILDLSVREIFFSRKVLCVEGKGDLSRYLKFFSENVKGFSEWTIIKMDNKQGLRKFKKTLDIFGPEHKIILDLDGICCARERAGMKTDIFRDLLPAVEADVVSLAKTKRLELLDSTLNKDEKKLKKKIISDLARENIYVLNAGELEDYLDKNGKVVGDDAILRKELLDFFA
jgi:AAA15 family ATPase/GTPase